MSGGRWVLAWRFSQAFSQIRSAVGCVSCWSIVSLSVLISVYQSSEFQTSPLDLVLYFLNYLHALSHGTFLNTVILSVSTNCRLTALAMVYRNGQVHRAVYIYRKIGVDRAIAKQVTKGRSVIHTNWLRHCASFLCRIVSFSLCRFQCLCVSFSLSPYCALIPGVTFVFFPFFRVFTCSFVPPCRYVSLSLSLTVFCMSHMVCRVKVGVCRVASSPARRSIGILYMLFSWGPKWRCGAWILGRRAFCKASTNCRLSTCKEWFCRAHDAVWSVEWYKWVICGSIFEARCIKLKVLSSINRKCFTMIVFY